MKLRKTKNNNSYILNNQIVKMKIYNMDKKNFNIFLETPKMEIEYVTY